MSDELKTPWKLKDANVIRNANGITKVIAETGLAAAIVHRVNCHDDLVEALGDIVEQYVFYAGENNDSVKLARAALELAKGGGHG